MKVKQFNNTMIKDGQLITLKQFVVINELDKLVSTDIFDTKEDADTFICRNTNLAKAQKWAMAEFPELSRKGTCVRINMVVKYLEWEATTTDKEVEEKQDVLDTDIVEDTSIVKVTSKPNTTEINEDPPFSVDLVTPTF